MSESKVSHWKQTIIAAMTSYIDAGSIVAGAAGLTLWKTYLDLTGVQVGLVTLLSSNAVGAALGAILGGPICDKYGRKFVYTYDLLIYIAGMLMIVFGSNYPMLLCGYLIVGLAVGADVVASWTLIAEQAPAEDRARHCGAAQVFWAVGPAVVLGMAFLLGTLFTANRDSLLAYFNGGAENVPAIVAADGALADAQKAIDAAKKEEADTATADANKAEALKAEAMRAIQIAVEKENALRQLQKAEPITPDTATAEELMAVSKEKATLSSAFSFKNTDKKTITDYLQINYQAGFFRTPHLELLNNRIVFAHLIIVAFIVWLLRLRMPESDNWKQAKLKAEELIASGKVKRLGMASLLQWVNLKTVLFLCGVYVVWNWAAGTMGFLLPYIYQNVGGISNSMSCALTVILFVASAISTLTIFMAWGDRISRRLIYFCIATLFIIAWGLFLLPKEYMMLGSFPLIFVLISILMGINNGSGQQAFYQLWCNELFPSYYRASAQGLTFFVARITVGLWTACVPIIMDNWGFAPAAWTMVGFAAVSMIVGTVFAPNTSGKTLQQIEDERYGN